MPATGLLQHSHAPSTETPDAPVRVTDVVIVVPGLLTVPADDGAGAAPTAAPAPAPVAPDPEPEPLAGLIRVDRGRPTAEELAAVVTVLLARAAAAGAAGALADGRPARSAPRWRRPDRGHGYRTAHSWQAARPPRRARQGAL
ncbi:acyl-CoA carboxylase epsilon subunit [Streptomyces griseoviridis]